MSDMEVIEYSSNTHRALWKRTGYVLCGIIVVFLLCIPLVRATGMFLVPDYRIAGLSLVSWVCVNSLVPSTVLFLVGFCTGVTILPLSDLSYSWWIVRNNGGRILRYLLFVYILAMGSALMISGTSSELNHRMSEGAISLYQGSLYLTAMSLVTIFPAWLGYRCSWVSYVGSYKDMDDISGTTTRQGRWERHLQDLETKNVGQAWDKFFDRTYAKMSGSDGHKPRGFTLWFIIMFTFTSIAWVFIIGTYSNNSVLVSFVFFLIVPLILLVFTVIIKIHDMTTSKRLPYLRPIVGEYNENDNSVNYANTGARKFSRI